MSTAVAWRQSAVYLWRISGPSRDNQGPGKEGTAHDCFGAGCCSRNPSSQMMNESTRKLIGVNPSLRARSSRHPAQLRGSSEFCVYAETDDGNRPTFEKAKNSRNETCRPSFCAQLNAVRRTPRVPQEVPPFRGSHPSTPRQVQLPQSRSCHGRSLRLRRRCALSDWAIAPDSGNTS